MCASLDCQWLLHKHRENLTFLLHFRTVRKACWPPGTLSMSADLNFTIEIQPAEGFAANVTAELWQLSQNRRMGDFSDDEM